MEIMQDSHSENLNERDHSEDIVIGEKIISEWIFGK
jgi:hypothetical protein